MISADGRDEERTLVKPPTRTQAGRPPGRPRSEQADAAIIDATLQLLAETMSVAQLSVEMVAARAGVAKSTIYRRWPNKVLLIIDALKQLHPGLIEVRGRSVRDDLIAILGSLQNYSDLDLAGRLFKCILVEEYHHPELVKEYFAQIVEPRREQIREVLRRGMTAGELRPDTDIEIAVQCLGSLQSRLKLESRQATSDTVARTVDLVLGGIARRG